MSLSIKDLNLSKEQGLFINYRAIRSAAWFTFQILIASILLLIVPIIVMTGNTTDASGDAVAQTMGIIFLLAIVIMISGFLLQAKFFLKRALQKPVKNHVLKYASDAATFNFGTYSWKWFFVLLGVQIALCIVIAALGYVLPFQLPSSIGGVCTFMAYYMANYYIIVRLLKSGNATIESVLN